MLAECNAYHMDITVQTSSCISRVSDKNGVSLLYIMLEIHHSGQEPLIYNLYFTLYHH